MERNLKIMVFQGEETPNLNPTERRKIRELTIA